MQNKPHPISLHALFGGTFDPIHYGHLKPVIALAHQAELQHITLLPNHVPPHRPQPEANAQQRLEMVKRAVADNTLFSVDDRELHRTTASYTIDTLQELRQEQGPQTALAFIIGQDSLLTLHKWHRWQELIDYCHLLVCARPGYAAQLDTPALQQWLNQHLTNDAQQLKQQTHGLIYLANTPLLNISATEIRRRHQQGLSCNDLLPPAVQDYIAQHQLYR